MSIENFHTRLNAAMKHSGYNPAEFERAIGASNGYIKKVLSGNTKPSIDKVQKMIAALRSINHAWLMFGEGEMINSTFQSLSKEIPYLKPVSKPVPFSKSEKLDTENRINANSKIEDIQFQYQTMSSFADKQEIDLLKSEIVTLKGVIQMQEATLRAYESAIKAQETTIETLKTAKFPTKAPILDIVNP